MSKREHTEFSHLYVFQVLLVKGYRHDLILYFSVTWFASFEDFYFVLCIAETAGHPGITTAILLFHIFPTPLLYTDLSYTTGSFQ